MRDLEKRLHEGNCSENLDQQVIRVKPTWAAEGGTESHPKVIHSSPRGQPRHTPRLSASHEEHLQMKGYPERRGEGGWDFARIVEILVRRRRRRGMARSFRGGGWWQKRS